MHLNRRHHLPLARRARLPTTRRTRTRTAHRRDTLQDPRLRTNIIRRHARRRRMLSISPKQPQYLLHAQLAGTALSALDGLVGELTLLFLQVENALFDRVGDGDFVDDDVDGLRETVHAVDGLFFDELGGVSRSWRERGVTYGVPERLEDDYTSCCCQIET